MYLPAAQMGVGAFVAEPRGTMRAMTTGILCIGTEITRGEIVTAPCPLRWHRGEESVAENDWVG